MLTALCPISKSRKPVLPARNAMVRTAEFHTGLAKAQTAIINDTIDEQISISRIGATLPFRRKLCMDPDLNKAHKEVLDPVVTAP